MLYSIKNIKHNIDNVMTQDQLIDYANNYCTIFVFEVFGEVEEFHLTLHEAIEQLQYQHYDEDCFNIKAI
jgi:hypothetical protein